MARTVEKVVQQEYARMFCPRQRCAAYARARDAPHCGYLATGRNSHVVRRASDAPYGSYRSVHRLSEQTPDPPLCTPGEATQEDPSSLSSPGSSPGPLAGTTVTPRRRHHGEARPNQEQGELSGAVVKASALFTSLTANHRLGTGPACSF